jgi:hypothetical protein
VLREIALPTFDAVVKQDDRGAAAAALAETALAIARHAHAHGGRLPADLDELVPAFLGVLPADPWSARPLRYDRESARLWTLGPDGTDNGGARAVPEDSGLAGLRDKDGPAIELGAWLGLRE